MGQMDKLPTVISCCFCCFLRAGTVMISIVSFIAGLLLAPNVSHAPGFWDMHGVLSKGSSGTEMTVQMILGMVSIMLCVVSILLLIGSLCNCPKLLEIYQWGAVIYSVTIFVLLMILALYCVIVHGNCAAAGGMLLFLTVSNVLVTAYFVIVVNSLRMSMVYLTANTFDI